MEPMWEYWRDKKGIVEALEQQYPELINSGPQLDMAIALNLETVRCCLERIDNLMKAKGV